MPDAQNDLWSAIGNTTSLSQFLLHKPSISFDDFLKHSPLSEKEIALQASRLLGVPYVDLSNIDIHNCCMECEHAVFITENTIGISDPTQLLSLLASNVLSSKRIRLVCLTHSDRIRFLYQQRKVNWQKRLKSSTSLSISSLAKFCCHYALQMRASDLQLLPQKKEHILSLRVDGLRHQTLSIPPELSIRLARHYLLQAKLSYTKREAQDGTLVFNDNSGEKRLRLHTCRSNNGMSISIRLPRNTQHYTLDALKLTQKQHSQVVKSLSHSQGLIFVTGPTGSGKTQTLYTYLHHLAMTGRHVISLEDPIEQALPGVTQIPIQANTDLAYTKAMMHILRQDPDVIMIGELRSTETARLALQAAQSGHLVLVSCHSSHSLATCGRLKQLGLPLSELTHIPTLLIAQRLVRLYCRYCFKYHSKGCLHCQDGYRDRRSITECLDLSPELIQSLTCHDLKQITRLTRKQFWMRDHAKLLIERDLTSFDECLRVLGPLLEDGWHAL